MIVLANPKKIVNENKNKMHTIKFSMDLPLLNQLDLTLIQNKNLLIEHIVLTKII